VRVSAAAISRYLARAGLVTPDPAKRPKSSYLRFAAELPSQCWQSDFTHYPLDDGTDAEILSWLDDHSRYALQVTAHHRVSGRGGPVPCRRGGARRSGSDLDRHSSWVMSRKAARCPAGGVRLPGDRRLLAVVDDRPERAAA
jgi:transposase InsO family protein